MTKKFLKQIKKCEKFYDQLDADSFGKDLFQGYKNHPEVIRFMCRTIDEINKFHYVYYNEKNKVIYRTRKSNNKDVFIGVY